MDEEEELSLQANQRVVRFRMEGDDGPITHDTLWECIDAWLHDMDAGEFEDALKDGPPVVVEEWLGRYPAREWYAEHLAEVLQEQTADELLDMDHGMAEPAGEPVLKMLRDAVRAYHVQIGAWDCRPNGKTTVTREELRAFVRENL